MIFNRTVLLKYLLFVLLITSSCINRDNDQGLDEVLFNTGWQFLIDSDRTVITDSVISNPDQFTWESIILPHTPVIEPLVITGNQWQGNCYYYKKFDNPDQTGNKLVFLRFGAAMHMAKVYLNGELLTTHLGGYLPFLVELSGNIMAKDNLLVIELNNEDNQHIPPGKPMATLDFNYYGGLYRDVEILVKNRVYITDPVAAGKISGGGIYIAQDSVSRNRALLNVKVDVSNSYSSDEEIAIKFNLTGPAGQNLFSRTTDLLKISGDADLEVKEGFEITKPDLWSPETPVLYTLEVFLFNRGRVTEVKKVRIGFRNIVFDSDGFNLNGSSYKIRGTNRHQEYPYIGYAIGNNADYRDAYKIKKAGFNFVRLSHYPHSESFLDACDELGLLVMDAIPGWQFVGDSLFLENSKQDLKDMIRRDRNHPSVILWEASLNESWMPYSFIEEMHAITKQELPGRDAFTCGWMDTIYDVFIPARQHAKPPGYWNDYSKPKSLLIAEYGDWEYYAQNAGFNQAEYEGLLPDERTSRQLRANGQKRLVQQALNYQESHNDNLAGNHAGDANWLMFDYNRGYAPDIESSGIMDIFRLPKFSYYFYRSQKLLSSGDTVLFIANYWDDPEFADIKVFSNCDSIELWLNEELIDKRGPDNDRYSANLAHPPFTFRGAGYEPGKIEAKAFIGDRFVKSDTRLTPGKESGINLEVDYSGRPVNPGSYDIVFIYASIIDENGSLVPDAENSISFKLQGEGELIGNNPAEAEAGIATILFRSSGKHGEAIVKASAEGIEEAIVKIEVK